MSGSGRRRQMARDKDIREELAEKYGITDEGDIVSLTDLEMREEVLPASHEENPKDDSCSLCG